MKRSVLAGAILLIAAAIVGALAFHWYRNQTVGQAYGAPFALTDMRGNDITEAAFRGKPSAVFFGFTHCPEVCPTTLFELDGWLTELGPDGDKINAYFVTVDPERDTPDAVNTYISNVSQRITGISGDPAKVHDMARSFGIYSKKVDLEGGDYTMDHTASIIMLNRAGDFAGTIAYGENPQNALAKLKRLADG